MSQERHQRVWELFDEAAGLNPEDRKAFLEAACAEDDTLRSEVESLLTHDARLSQAQHESFLQSPLLRAPGQSILPLLPTPNVEPSALTQRIGGYRLLGVLGEGGMGTVYEALQDNPRRPVALKVIRPGISTPSLLKRFSHEAQILGRLHHPGIAQVFEAGITETGQPYFAMELIRGMPLDRHARSRALGIAGRLALFAKVCDAVQHAHDKGVIHRDLKPGNILVDEAGEPKVLDFGVARATDADVMTTTGRTEMGQLLGTLSYMSPEQIAADPALIDQRSDVFTLGVILYHLLADRPPYQLDNMPLPEVVRLILEHEPPRLGLVNARYRGDVETIVARAIEKNKARRYPSAGELAADVRRHLNHEPIRARPISVPEQLLRFGLRHKPLAATAMLLVLLTAASIVAAIYYHQQESRQRALAEEKSELAVHNQELANEKAAALLRAETTLVDMQTARGLLAGERGDAARAVLWFARAAEQANLDPQRQMANRLRARNWSRSLTIPLHDYPLQGTMRSLAFQPRGKLLLALADDRLSVRDWEKDQFLPWSEEIKSVGAACWSPDGAWLAIGFHSGDVQLRSVPDGEVVYAFQHPGAITALAFSPNCRHLVVAGTKLPNGTAAWTGIAWDMHRFPTPATLGDTMVLALDVTTRKLLPAHGLPGPPVHAIAFNRAGTRFVTAGVDRQARVYAMADDTEPERQLYDPIPHEPRYHHPPIFVDGDRLLVTVRRFQANASQPSELSIWDAETGRLSEPPIVLTKPSHVPRILASPQGDWFAACGHYGPEVWRVADKGTKPTYCRDHTGYVEDLASFPDGKTVLSVSWDQTARLWSVDDGRQQGSPLPHMGVVSRCAVSDDNVHLATYVEGLVRIWRRDPAIVPETCPVNWSGRCRASMDGRLLTPGIWHEQANLFAPIGPGPLILHSLLTGNPVGPGCKLPGPLVDSCICADNRTVAALSGDERGGWLSLLDVESGQDLLPPLRLPSSPRSVAARPGSHQVSVLCAGGELLVFDRSSGVLVFELRHDGQSASLRSSRVEYVPDGGTLVALVSGNAQVISVWDADSGRLRFPPIRPVLQGGPCRSFALSPDGRLLATAVNGRNAAQVWSLATGAAVSEPLPHPGDSFGLFCLCFSDNGRRLLTGCKDGQARLWDWQAGTLVCPPLKHQDEVFAVALLPDGQHALTAGRLDAGKLHVWELTTGKLVAPPVPLPSSVCSVWCSADGKNVVASGLGHVLRFDPVQLLTHADVPPAGYLLLGELVSGQRIEQGDESGLTRQEWLDRLRQLRLQYPALAR